MPTISLSVNGRISSINLRDADEPLLYVLRDRLHLKGTRFGCGLGQCGACTVMVDGEATRSCQLPASAAVGRPIITIEGLGSPDALHPLQAAFIAEQAAQCGYCASGMVMAGAALLQKTAAPSLDEVKNALADNLCRCGTHQRILAAVMRASGRIFP
jgi:nicotinate dehydrogenase subunit A